MQQPLLQRPLIGGIRVWQLLALLGFYAFFAFQYWLALWYTSDGHNNAWREALIDYFLLKLLLTAPLWWLYFVGWKTKPLRFKLLLHLLTGPLWVWAWFNGYRWVQDLRGAGYLQGSGIWWDVYIPFLVYCVQFAVFHVYGYYLQTEQQKQKEKMLMQLAYNSELNALKAQLQPHFLFNTLNSISASVPPQMEHTRELIAKLADTFRYGLKASGQEWIPLEEELRFTRTTLELEQERLKKRLQVVFEVDAALLSLPVPPMLLQPITENAIKHGIAPSLAGGTITIRVERRGNGAHIAICNTGLGYQGPAEDLQAAIFQKGIGLRNTNLRLEKLYGQRMAASQSPTGQLCFSFTIPLPHD
jgi:two-component system, LytTR family, sensor kinase